jgi:hypothetical protein
MLACKCYLNNIIQNKNIAIEELCRKWKFEGGWCLCEMWKYSGPYNSIERNVARPKKCRMQTVS